MIGFLFLDGTKIPCFKENYNEFKYTYSLKKDPHTNYFQKYTIVNFNGKLIAIHFLVSLKFFITNIPGINSFYFLFNSNRNQILQIQLCQ